jgi:hypothetical protein
MSTMLKEVYDALKEAGASEEKASAAAVAVSAYTLDRTTLATKEDIARLERSLAVVEERTEGRFKLLQWMIGFNLALTAAVLIKLFL